jgi:hypothetical protein
MKATDMANKPNEPSRANRGAHSQAVGWISRQTSSRRPVEGETFFLTSLFIELIEAPSGNLIFEIRTSAMTRFRCASDRSHHLLPDQATEWSDQRPVRAKLSSCRDICAQYSSLGPQLRGAVRPYTHFEVPSRLRGSRRGGCTELNWAGGAQFSTGTPKATNCADHEFFAGALPK